MATSIKENTIIIIINNYYYYNNNNNYNNYNNYNNNNFFIQMAFITNGAFEKDSVKLKNPKLQRSKTKMQFNYPI